MLIGPGFAVLFPGSLPEGSINCLNAEGGSDPFQLSDDTSPSPSWSPDDSFLVLRGRAEGKNGIVKLDLITDEKILLAGGGKLRLGFPHWRPDAQPMPDLLP